MTNYSDIEKELDSIGYTADNLDNLRVRDTVLELFHTLDAQDLTNDQQDAALKLFDILSKGQILQSILRVDTPGTAKWSEFKVGETRVGTTVRVRADAYTGVGAKHNRLVGTLVAVRGGRAVVQYSGRSDGIGHSHDPRNLEVLEK